MVVRLLQQGSGGSVPSGVLFVFFLWSLLAAEASAQDLSPLFAPPSAEELAAVRQDWASRDPLPSNANIDRTANIDGYQMDRISFDLDGLHQYGLVRYPRNFEPGRSYPVLMLLHGGFSGLWYGFTLNFDADYPDGCLGDNFFVVSPTYRGEAFSGGDLGNVMSEGEPSPWDRDVDDSMAMLTAVLELIPETDADRVMAQGHSRGGNVAYHLAVRDARVKRTVVLFGPSQFREESIEAECQAHVDGGSAAENGLSIKVLTEIVDPWFNGQMSLQQARHLLTAWSVCDLLPAGLALEVHHGLADESVPPVQSFLVADQMEGAQPQKDVFALHTYPDGEHNPATLHGHAARIESFLCAPIDTTAVPPPSPTGMQLRAWPNPFQQRINLSALEDGEKAASATDLLVEVIDLRGRRVAQVVLPAGQSTLWLAQDRQGRLLPAGQYRLRLPAHPEVPARLITHLR